MQGTAPNGGSGIDERFGVRCRVCENFQELWLVKICARCKAVNVSQQALSKRFLEFRAEMFEQVLWSLVLELKRRFLTGAKSSVASSASPGQSNGPTHLKDCRWLDPGSPFSETEKFA